MRVLVVSDIFGKTPALEELAKAMPVTTDIIDPYDGKFMAFKDEQEAYNYFCNEVGLDSYCLQLKKQVDSLKQPVVMIGFSVGASAIWKLSAHMDMEKVKSAACFYGSQIRHELNIRPVFPITLILPASEKHFSIEQFRSDLKERDNVSFIQSRYFHGFMNKYSKNFSEEGYHSMLSLFSNIVLST